MVSFICPIIKLTQATQRITVPALWATCMSLQGLPDLRASVAGLRPALTQWAEAEAPAMLRGGHCQAHPLTLGAASSPGSDAGPGRSDRSHHVVTCLGMPTPTCRSVPVPICREGLGAALVPPMPCSWWGVGMVPAWPGTPQAPGPRKPQAHTAPWHVTVSKVQRCILRLQICPPSYM